MSPATATPQPACADRISLLGRMLGRYEVLTRLASGGMASVCIMVGVDSVCRVTDFGVAKTEVRLAHTRAGQAKGKRGYMAPEHAATGDADQRSPAVSAGCPARRDSSSGSHPPSA